MTDAAAIPDWLGGAMIGAVIAALGYVSKLVIEAVAAWRRARAERLMRLLELASLLRASRAVFLKQNDLAVTLAAKLCERHPNEQLQSLSYGAILVHFHDRLDEQEGQTHQYIRGLTQHAMRPLNLKLTKWLRSDREFRTARASRRGARGVGESRTSAALPTDSSNADKRDFHDAGVHLANQLNHLDIHLTLWHAKFKAWMHDPRHALIYMDDEQDEGVQFPDGLDQAIEQMLQSQRLRVVERGKEDKPTDRSIELQ